MRKLVDSNFEYPLKECDTPSQYAYKLMGDEKLANEHTYPIMHAQGRMASFNAFMEGKFGKFGSMPDRVRGFGYDLDAAVAGPVVMVDIGGGKGEVLLELKQAYPHLQTHQLVLQEFNAEIKDVPGLTMMDWDYKSEIPQAVRGALMYSLTHIFHNLPDLDALQLMRKISDAMALHSKLLIHEFPKNKTYGKMHAAMIVQYGGRERSSKEWHQMAMMAGLKVTFEKYPMFGEGLVEMRKIDQLKEQDVIDEAYRSGESSTERVCAERGRSL